jgi:ATP-binding cassette subfamily F protein uup
VLQLALERADISERGEHNFVLPVAPVAHLDQHSIDGVLVVIGFSVVAGGGIETLELLEALLQDYAGTVLLVSHDRAFLDNVVTQVIAFDGDGRWLENPGGYQEWARVLRARADARRVDAVTEQPAPRAESARAPRPPKLTWKEQQELKELPARIEALEREQGELGRKLADPAFYSSAPAQVREANERFQDLEALLLAALERWTELEGKAR